MGGFSPGVLLEKGHSSCRQAVQVHLASVWLSSLQKLVAVWVLLRRDANICSRSGHSVTCRLDLSSLTSGHPGNPRDTGWLCPAGGAVDVHEE